MKKFSRKLQNTEQPYNEKRREFLCFLVLTVGLETKLWGDSGLYLCKDLCV